MLINQLFETKMSPNVFNRSLDNSADVKLGYEIEMWINDKCLLPIQDISVIDDSNWNTKKEEWMSTHHADAVFSQYAYSFSNVLGNRGIYQSATIGGDPTKVSSTWKIVSDTSIEGTGKGIGLELCTPTPPEKLSIALKKLKVIFEFMTKYKIETNTSTGFHINVSFPGMVENLDWVKLFLFLGDSYILQSFNRVGNTFALPVSSDIITKIKLALRDGVFSTQMEADQLFDSMKSSKSMQDWAKLALSSNKNRTINYSKLDHGYLEFRAAGNSNYHMDYEKIHNTIGRIITALKIASDPTAYRKEYIKKLASLMTNAINQFDMTKEKKKSKCTFKSLLRLTSNSKTDLVALWLETLETKNASKALTILRILYDAASSAFIDFEQTTDDIGKYKFNQNQIKAIDQLITLFPKSQSVVAFGYKLRKYY